jgi:hypothetical protein
MQRNSGKGEAENNNLDEQQGKKGPAQKSALFDNQEDQAGASPPSDSRGARK